MNVDGGGDTEAVVISVQIPDGAEPGDSLSFEADGQSFTIEIPVASVAGEILQIKLANSTSEKDVAMEDVKADDDDDGNKITIEMATGSKISVLQTTDSGQSTSNGTLSDGTYQLLWPASRFIVNFINTPKFRRQFQDSPAIHSVIELGAGHGMLGMAFAETISNFTATGKPVKLLLTDVEEALPQLEANIQINRKVFGQRVEISTLPLKWHSHPMSQTSSNLDFILGSDLLYNCSAIPDLVATIRRLLSKSTKILLSVRVSAYSNIAL